MPRTLHLLFPTHGAVLVDAIYRAGYRVAFHLLRLWWRLRRPDHRGALVAVWVGRRVLMLRQSYRDLLDFPGGGIEGDEAPVATACRELAEETGITLRGEDLTHVRDMVAWSDYRRDHVSIFECYLEFEPHITVDNREIVAAGFMDPDAALGARISPFVRAYLEGVAVR